MYCIDIYTDGSATKHGERVLGIGAVCIKGDKEYIMSAKITPEMFFSYGIHSYADCSNPTAELVAVAEVLKTLKLDPHRCIMFYVDYIGVMSWLEGRWKCNKPYIKILVDYCMKRMKELGGVFKFSHVKGHSGNTLNDRADLLASSMFGINTFTELN